jgi:hypothetical protein
MSLAVLLSPAQLLGYLAFVLGVACFMQTDDRRFKILMALECLAYALHFWLLGQPTAMASSLVSLTRSVASMRSRSPWLALFFVLLSLGLGAWLARDGLALLPILASCIGTTALFLLQGLRMRLMMMVGTLLWVSNNLIVGSVGGTALELVIAVTNSLTIWRLWRESRRRPEVEQPAP